MHFTWIISSLCIDELLLHMVENTNLTYAKVSCSLVLIDSLFSHAMKNVHYPRLPYKVHLSFSDFLFLEILDKRRSF